MSSAEINDLKSRVGDARAKLQEAERRLLEAQIEAVGVAVGDLVLDRKGVEYRVTKVQPFSVCGAWVTGSPRRKNGGWSRVERCLYGDWTRAPAAPQEPTQAA